MGKAVRALAEQGQPRALQWATAARCSLTWPEHDGGQHLLVAVPASAAALWP